METRSPEKNAISFRSIVTFLQAILQHWRAFLVGVFLNSLTIWILQNEGRAIPHWAYWLAGVVGIVFASFRAWDEERRKADALSRDVERLKRPALEVECGDDVKGSMARNRPVGIWGRKGVADFFGFVLTNVSGKTIHKCRCDLVLLERIGMIEPLFSEFTALPFAPRDPEQELATEADIRSGESIPASLCTIIDTNRVRFGSLGNKWRFPEQFEDFFTEFGDYVFHVRITGDDCPTVSVKFILVWTGNRATSIMKLVPKVQ
ncbi:MAG TPA: hypothetical protein VHD62_01700 [Opitutaceae bacterium]|nr:hypothetical protein [Opitutaceae bacterium]HVT55293.1 hypothetical protein [Xanthobacteraceae bacterium]